MLHLHYLNHLDPPKFSLLGATRTKHPMIPVSLETLYLHAPNQNYTLLYICTEQSYIGLYRARYNVDCPIWKNDEEDINHLVVNVNL